MTIDYSKIDYYQNLAADDVPATPLAWLHSLSSSSVIDFVGHEKHPWRVITSLLKGNSPSGLIAIHRLIKAGAFAKLKVNVRIIIASVEAAQQKPAFSNSVLPGGTNLDRCFGSTSLSHYYLRAQLLASSIRQVKPEAIVDMQNSQTTTKPFAMSIKQSHDHLALTSLFCQTLIVSNLKLGAIFEQAFNCPIISVQCGDAQDKQSHQLTETGLIAFIEQKDLTLRELPVEIDVIHDPKLISLAPDTSLTWQTTPTETDTTLADITLNDSITKHSFSVFKQLTQIGWTNNQKPRLLISNQTNDEQLSNYITVESGQIFCQPGTFVFAVNSPLSVSANDTLFYIAREEVKLRKK